MINFRICRQPVSPMKERKGKIQKLGCLENEERFFSKIKGIANNVLRHLEREKTKKNF